MGRYESSRSHPHSETFCYLDTVERGQVRPLQGRGSSVRREAVPPGYSPSDHSAMVRAIDGTEISGRWNTEGGGRRGAEQQDLGTPDLPSVVALKSVIYHMICIFFGHELTVTDQY